jgi:hypothetical protein
MPSKSVSAISPIITPEISGQPSLSRTPLKFSGSSIHASHLSSIPSPSVSGNLKVEIPLENESGQPSESSKLL